MEFKELTEIWKQSEMHQDEAIKVNHQLIKEVGLNKIKTNLRAIQWSSIFEIVLEILFSGFLINFMENQRGQPAFSIPAALILGLIAFNVLFEVYRLALFYSIKTDCPVLKAQKKLSRLKKLEIFDTYSLLVIIPVFALPFLIVLAKALLNWDLYELGTGWMIQTIIGSFVVAAILVVIIRKHPNKKLRKAIQFIEELDEE
ncbi:hypothetical protein [Marinilabilia rubra]|uniref:Uncharacterized protein n=1 Tax=Marinilabilia rubra TaxID=2162893 RepID=A0A2U2B517_9BACT|nr:hypothetical protein [Marinilabilia rubra]PWD98152.1 hypothetical protein DDZ16_16800 [Marinilabilia rubra]